VATAVTAVTAAIAAVAAAIAAVAAVATIATAAVVECGDVPASAQCRHENEPVHALEPPQTLVYKEFASPVPGYTQKVRDLAI
jgi:hypothetical protein